MTESSIPGSDNTEQSPDEPVQEASTETNDETIRLDDGEEVVELNKQDVVELNEFLEHVQIVLLSHEQRLALIEQYLSSGGKIIDEETPDEPGQVIPVDFGENNSDVS